MWFPAIKLHSVRPILRLHAFHALSRFSTSYQGQSSETVFYVSNTLGKPNWQKNKQLKCFVSHLSPVLVSEIIALKSKDVHLCLNFLKLVCKQSTYCYDIDGRIQLLYLLASYNLYEIVHKVLIFLINECSSSRDGILRIIGAIEDMEENNGFRINYPCYSTLLICLAKLNMGLVSFMVFKKMVEGGFVASELDYRSVVNALCKNGFVQSAEMFLSRVLKFGVPIDVYICTSLVLGYCRTGELNKAFEVFTLMSEKDSCGFNSVTYSILVHGLCEIGRLDDARKLKDEMVEKGCEPSTRTYTVLIKAMCDKGLIGEAFLLLDEMTKKGCKPNVYTYTVVVDMLCREDRIEEANGMFLKMLNDEMNPGIVTYNALINGYCKHGRVVSAFELLGLMERKHCKPNIRTYNELIEGLCKSGRPYKAVVVLGRIMINGLFPTEVTFNILIDGLCKVGNLNMAFEFLRFMSSIGESPDHVSYTAFIDSLCKLGRLDEAEVFIALMIKKGISLDEVTLTALIHGYCMIGKTKYAFRLLEEMINDGRLTSPHTFNIFLDGLSKEVKLVEENAMLGKLLKCGLSPSVVTYTILVDGLCRAGDTESALKMVEHMTKADCPPNVYTFAIIINSHCQNGRLENAVDVLTEMQRNGVSPNDTVYAILVRSFVAAGKLNRAVDIMTIMLENGCQPNAQIYSALLSGILNTDRLSPLKPEKVVFKEINIHHAFKLLEICSGCLLGAFNFLIIGLCRTGRISEADLFIHEMVKNGLTPDTDICASIIEHLCKTDDYNSCLEWIARFDEYGCVLSFSSQASVILGLQNEGRSVEAELLIFNMLQNLGDEGKVVILPYISFLVKGNVPYKFSEVLKMADEIGNDEMPIV